ncbi:MAG: SemiSWEET family sugar transporter [Nitrospira sp.]|nr:SemiSWEET family sugar transporter [Nitrospira sp.]
MTMVTLLGLAAGTLTTLAFLPQLIKTWRTRSADDVSLGMLLTLCSGIILWIIYGLSIHDLPLILANGVTFILAFMILCLKIRYKA